MILLSAELVLPLALPIIQDGAVAVQGEKILALGPRKSLKKKFPKAEEIHHDLLMPGLVNAHTHLNFSGSKLINTKFKFADWLVKAREAKLKTDPAKVAKSAKKEIGKFVSSGVTSLGDIVGDPETLELHKQSPLHSTIFYELIGLRGEEAGEKIDLAENIFGEHNFKVGRNMLGLSPHTPFTASREMFRAATELAKKKKLAMCTHLAESEDEVQFIRSGTGPILEKLFRAAGWKGKTKACGCTPAEYLEEFISRNLTPVHCVEISDDDLEIIKNARAVVHCLRSNLNLTGKFAPVPKMIAAGIKVALGTDSPASAGDADLWNEMKAVLDNRKKYPGGEIRPYEILKMATINGAVAIFRDQELGSIASGKTANLLALNLKTQSKNSDRIAEEIIRAGKKAVDGVYIAGEKKF
jgi:aminodeoxyfutalosine deaminase